MIKKIFPFVLLTLAFLGACKEADNSAATSDELEMKYKLTPFNASVEFPDAAISSMEFKDGMFNFGISGESYQLGVQTSDADLKMCANSGEGQHLHLIVNDEPYAAKYTSSFDYEIPDGEHYLLAFLSRSYHESIKTDAANVTKKVTITNNTISSSEDVADPMVFYSRPKGAYIGKDTEKVMLDFYIKNITLAPNGNKVIAEINGETYTVDTWQPYYVEGLPMGENTIKLSLVDNNGNLIETPLNPVSRTFTLQEDPTPVN